VHMWASDRYLCAVVLIMACVSMLKGNTLKHIGTYQNICSIDETLVQHNSVCCNILQQVGSKCSVLDSSLAYYVLGCIVTYVSEHTLLYCRISEYNGTQCSMSMYTEAYCCILQNIGLCCTWENKKVPLRMVK
jgi:hypothetical protein